MSDVVTRGIKRGTLDREARIDLLLGMIPRGSLHAQHRRTWTRVCSGCGGPRDRGQQKAYCRECHNAYARENRPKQRELLPEAKRRANVRAHTKMLVKRGHMVKTACACGSPEVTAEHLNWTDPRAIVWKCKACRAGVRRSVAA